jgi:hypothetical protein
MFHSTPFIVSGAALAATLPDTLNGIQAPPPATTLADWVLRTGLLVIVTVILDEYRYLRDKRRRDEQR